ncbi:MAG: DNA polymerase IV [Coriobacteriia bacterium]|nr:DNA polymerase IV [Coriobacteriia bacterium]
METSLPAWTDRAILHMDMDAFFASAEQLDHPEWRGLPVIVGGSATGRGVVSTASYEARRFGIHSAMPSAQATRLCPDAIWAKPRFERYHELACAVMEILTSFTPRVQQVSIDEAYLDVTPAGHADTHPVEIARSIRTQVDALGLSCSLGVATSRTVAKIASDHDKPHGITVVWPGEEAGFLAPLPVRALPGVGAATATRLRGAGIRTLGDLATLDPVSAAALLGSAGPDLVHRAGGLDDRPVGEDRRVKSVSHEHTFSTDIRELPEVEAVLRDLVERVAARLRRKGLAGRTLTVKVRHADFSTRTASKTLEAPTDLDTDMLPTARALVRSVWTPGAGLRLLGFGVSGFGAAEEQLGLFDEAPTEQRRRARSLVESIDRVKERFGDDAIGFRGPEPERDGPDSGD